MKRFCKHEVYRETDGYLVEREKELENQISIEDPEKIFRSYKRFYSGQK